MTAGDATTAGPAPFECDRHGRYFRKNFSHLVTPETKLAIRALAERNDGSRDSPYLFGCSFGIFRDPDQNEETYVSTLALLDRLPTADVFASPVWIVLLAWMSSFTSSTHNDTWKRLTSRLIPVFVEAIPFYNVPVEISFHGFAHLIAAAPSEAARETLYNFLWPHCIPGSDDTLNALPDTNPYRLQWCTPGAEWIARRVKKDPGNVTDFIQSYATLVKNVYKHTSCWRRSYDTLKNYASGRWLAKLLEETAHWVHRACTTQGVQFSINDLREMFVSSHLLAICPSSVVGPGLAHHFYEIAVENLPEAALCHLTRMGIMTMFRAFGPLSDKAGVGRIESLRSTLCTFVAWVPKMCRPLFDGRELRTIFFHIRNGRLFGSSNDYDSWPLMDYLGLLDSVGSFRNLCQLFSPRTVEDQDRFLNNYSTGPPPAKAKAAAAALVFEFLTRAPLRFLTYLVKRNFLNLDDTLEVFSEFKHRTWHTLKKGCTSSHVIPYWMCVLLGPIARRRSSWGDSVRELKTVLGWVFEQGVTDPLGYTIESFRTVQQYDPATGLRVAPPHGGKKQVYVPIPIGSEETSFCESVELMFGDLIVDFVCGQDSSDIPKLGSLLDAVRDKEIPIRFSDFENLASFSPLPGNSGDTMRLQLFMLAGPSHVPLSDSGLELAATLPEFDAWNTSRKAAFRPVGEDDETEADGFPSAKRRCAPAAPKPSRALPLPRLIDLAANAVIQSFSE